MGGEKDREAYSAATVPLSQVRQAVEAVLPKLALGRGQTLTKVDELGLEWADEILRELARMEDE